MILGVAAGGALAVWMRFELVAFSPPKARPATLDSGHPAIDPPPAQILLPSTSAPARGWPLLLGLHGYGSSGEKFATFGRWFPLFGIAVALPTGSDELSDGRYSWGGLGPPLERLRQEVGKAAANSPVDVSCPVLAGFSQGASMAAATAWLQPSFYCGVLAVSPVGALPSTQPGQARHPLPLVIMVGQRDAASQATTRALKEAWNKAGWVVHVFEHAGGHEAPANFGEQLATVLALLGLPSAQIR